jgi:hypothetical protein
MIHLAARWRLRRFLPNLTPSTLGGVFSFARIGVMRALNRHVVREFNPDRKDTHWGQRKLKRDM